MPSPWQKKAIRRRAINQREVQKKAAPYALAFAGASARRRYKSPVSCPYPLGSTGWGVWYGGWLLEHDKRSEREL